MSTPRRWRRGWHFTAARNLASIEKTGLEPYRIVKPNCDPWSRDKTLDVFGVYTWMRRPEEESLAGIVIQRLMDHQAWSVALLSYPYRPIDTYPRGHDVLTLSHEGVFYGNTGKRWYYHRQEPSMILLDTVPFERIRVERVWDLGVCLVGHTIAEEQS